MLMHALSLQAREAHGPRRAPGGARLGRRRMLRVAQLSVVLGECAGPVLYCFRSRSEAMALPRTPSPACRLSSEYSANVPPAPFDMPGQQRFLHPT